MKQITAFIFMTLMATTSFADATDLDVVGKSFCADDGNIVSSYSLLNDDLAEVRIKKSGAPGPAVLLGKGSWLLTDEGAVQITFAPLGNLWPPAVTDYELISESGLELVDPNSGHIFSECK